MGQMTACNMERITPGDEPTVVILCGRITRSDPLFYVAIWPIINEYTDRFSTFQLILLIHSNNSHWPFFPAVGSCLQQKKLR